MPANIVPTNKHMYSNNKKAQHYRTKQLDIKDYSCTQNYQKKHTEIRKDNGIRLSEKKTGL